MGGGRGGEDWVVDLPARCDKVTINVRACASRQRHEIMQTREDPNSKSAAASPAALATDMERYLLPFKALRIQALDEFGRAVVVRPKDGKPGGPIVASGFLVREESAISLHQLARRDGNRTAPPGVAGNTSACATYGIKSVHAGQRAA